MPMMIKTSRQPEPQLEITLDQRLGKPIRAILDGRRAVFLPESRLLMVSDLHWGKGEIFRQHGIPIPDSVLLADLARLSDLLKHYSPKRLLILGDLIHGFMGLTDALREKIRAWRLQTDIPMILIAGNHDRKIESVAQQWDIEVYPDILKEGTFLFSHQPHPQTGYLNWCGHIHPTVVVADRVDSLRLPCFYFWPGGATLPAFSEFTGGYNVKYEPDHTIFAISEELVIPI